jgi:hypothetical protein
MLDFGRRNRGNRLSPYHQSDAPTWTWFRMRFRLRFRYCFASPEHLLDEKRYVQQSPTPIEQPFVYLAHTLPALYVRLSLEAHRLEERHHLSFARAHVVNRYSSDNRVRIPIVVSVRVYIMNVGALYPVLDHRYPDNPVATVVHLHHHKVAAILNILRNHHRTVVYIPPRAVILVLPQRIIRKTGHV